VLANTLLQGMLEAGSSVFTTRMEFAMSIMCDGPKVRRASWGLATPLLLIPATIAFGLATTSRNDKTNL
jgi:hypothetical protein